MLSKVWGIAQLIAAGIWAYNPIAFALGKYQPDTITIVIALAATTLWFFEGAIKSYFKEEF